MSKFSVLLITILISPLTFASLQIENWDSRSSLAKNTVRSIAISAAKTTSAQLKKSRLCSGQLVAIYMTPGAFKKTSRSENQELNYQLSYASNSCKNKHMVTCSMLITKKNSELFLQKHICQTNDFTNLEGDANGTGRFDEPDSKSEYPNLNDDGIDIPSRPGSDIDDPNLFGF